MFCRGQSGGTNFRGDQLMYDRSRAHTHTHTTSLQAPSRSVRPRWTVPLLWRQPTNEGLIYSKEGSNIPIICVCSCCASEVEQQVI